MFLKFIQLHSKLFLCLRCKCFRINIFGFSEEILHGCIKLMKINAGKFFKHFDPVAESQFSDMSVLSYENILKNRVKPPFGEFIGSFSYKLSSWARSFI